MTTDEREKELKSVAELARTVPDSNGATFPRRVGTRSMLPTTWLGREVSVERTDAGGKFATTTGVLSDWCPAGPILRVGSARLIVSWETISLIELSGD